MDEKFQNYVATMLRFYTPEYTRDYLCAGGLIEIEFFYRMILCRALEVNSREELISVLHEDYPDGERSGIGYRMECNNFKYLLERVTEEEATADNPEFIKKATGGIADFYRESGFKINPFLAEALESYPEFEYNGPIPAKTPV